LLTRTFASPACVSQIPSGPAAYAFAGEAISAAVNIAIIKPNLQIIIRP
jgi:hypothetical protein